MPKGGDQISAARSDSYPARIVVTQAQIFSALSVLAIANATVNRAKDTIASSGWGTAILDGLGHSWAMWIASALGIALSLRAEPTRATRSDLAVGAGCLLLIALPVKELGAVAATAIAIWFLIRPGVPVRMAGASVIMIAVAVNLLWTPAAMLVLARPLAFVDAHLVGLMAATPAHGNMVGFVHGDGGMVIVAGCTSVANASLALLMWIAIARSVRPQSRPGDILIGAAIFLTVVAINVGRLALMAQDKQTFELVHGPVGAAICNLLITAAGLAWTAFDVRHELFGSVLGVDAGAGDIDRRREAAFAVER